MSLNKHYIYNDIVTMEEDYHHKFKGHRCLAMEELPLSSYNIEKREYNKKAISRVIQEKEVLFTRVSQMQDS